MASGKTLLVAFVLVIAVADCRNAPFSHDATFNYPNPLSDYKNDAVSKQKHIATSDGDDRSSVTYNKYNFNNTRYEQQDPLYDFSAQQQEQRQQTFEKEKSNNGDDLHAANDKPQANYGPKQGEQPQSFDKQNSRDGKFFSNNGMHPNKADNYYPQGEQGNEYPEQQQQQQQSFEEKNSEGGELTAKNMQRYSQGAASNRAHDEQRLSVMDYANSDSNSNDHDFQQQQQQQQNGGFSSHAVNFHGKQRQRGYDDDSSSSSPQENSNDYNERPHRRHAKPNDGSYGYGSVNNVDADANPNGKKDDDHGNNV
eukprot:TRINITY_DN2411_c0_g1_i1.p1 TRINITY_DN2411_c0_g1~~TRINITY_DN2411_c0_g1_i1.p1  ORF type:complete len:310 (-),score=34.98 TRINITY_DN2411_c0_g1_i1:208-1137(-)